MSEVLQIPSFHSKQATKERKMSFGVCSRVDKWSNKQNMFMLVKLTHNDIIVAHRRKFPTSNPCHYFERSFTMFSYEFLGLSGGCLLP